MYFHASIFSFLYSLPSINASVLRYRAVSSASPRNHDIPPSRCPSVCLLPSYVFCPRMFSAPVCFFVISVCFPLIFFFCAAIFHHPGLNHLRPTTVPTISVHYFILIVFTLTVPSYKRDAFETTRPHHVMLVECKTFIITSMITSRRFYTG